MGHYSRWYPSDFKEWMLYLGLSTAAFTAVGVAFAGVSTIIEYCESKGAGEEVSEKIGLNIKTVDEIYLHNNADTYSVVARCTAKNDEIVLLEYNVSQVDYIKMNDDDTDKMDYFRSAIIPNYEAKVVRESQTKAKTNVGVDTYRQYSVL